MKNKNIQPHITLGTDDSGLIIVRVEDTELYDFVSDHLIEQCGIEYEYLSTQEDVKPPIYTMYFSAKHDAEEIEQYLLGLNAIEIERIFLINNQR